MADWHLSVEDALAFMDDDERAQWASKSEQERDDIRRELDELWHAIPDPDDDDLKPPFTHPTNWEARNYNSDVRRAATIEWKKSRKGEARNGLVESESNKSTPKMPEPKSPLRLPFANPSEQWYRRDRINRAIQSGGRPDPEDLAEEVAEEERYRLALAKAFERKRKELESDLMAQEPALPMEPTEGTEYRDAATGKFISKRQSTRRRQKRGSQDSKTSLGARPEPKPSFGLGESRDDYVVQTKRQSVVLPRPQVVDEQTSPFTPKPWHKSRDWVGALVLGFLATAIGIFLWLVPKTALFVAIGLVLMLACLVAAILLVASYFDRGRWGLVAAVLISGLLTGVFGWKVWPQSAPQPIPDRRAEIALEENFKIHGLEQVANGASQDLTLTYALANSGDVTARTTEVLFKLEIADRFYLDKETALTYAQPNIKGVDNFEIRRDKPFQSRPFVVPVARTGTPSESIHLTAEEAKAILTPCKSPLAFDPDCERYLFVYGYIRYIDRFTDNNHPYIFPFAYLYNFELGEDGKPFVPYRHVGQWELWSSELVKARLRH